MDIQNIQFQLRRRRLDEIFDFGFMILRENLLRYVRLLALPVVVFLAMNFSLLYLLHSDETEFEFFSSQHLLIFVFVFAQRGVYSLLLTVYNGYLLFDERPDLKMVWQEALRVGLGYVWHQIILRGLYLIFLPWTLILPWRSSIVHFFKTEVMLLEKLRGTNMRQRLTAMSRGQGDRTILFHLMDGLLFLFYMMIASFTYNSVLEIFVLNQLSWWSDSHLSYFLLSPPVHILILPYLIYHSVVKFLFYIDARSLREGWDVELNLLRGAQQTLGGSLEDPAA